MGSQEVKYNRYVVEDELSNWEWPMRKVSPKEPHQMAIVLEIVVKFFFKHFIFMFGGENFLQAFWGPIGARVRMCVVRIVMQVWYESYKSHDEPVGEERIK